jgi:hypothetical protein
MHAVSDGHRETQHVAVILLAPAEAFACMCMQATVFAQEMGTAMRDVPVFGTNFNTWFPLVVVVYCTLL